MASFGSSGRFGGSVPPPKGLGAGRSLTKPEIKQVRNKLKAAAYSMGGVDWHRLFKHYDRTNSGELNLMQFKRALRGDAKITVSILPDNHVRHLFNTIDLDGGGTIDVDEFISWVDGGDDDEKEAGDEARIADTSRSSGYGRRAPTEMSSPSQRRYHFGQGRWLHNNDENSFADGVQFRQGEELLDEAEGEAVHAMFEAQLALEREISPPPQLMTIPQRQAKSGGCSSSSSSSSNSSSNSNSSKDSGKNKRSKVNRKKTTPTPYLRMRQEQDENERIIKSQAAQLAVLKLMVEQQYDALSPKQRHGKSPSQQRTAASALTPEKGQSEASPSLQTSATFTVRCHCGAMRGEFKCNKTQITCWDCNCSDCGMRRNLHFILPSNAFKTTSDCERVSTLYRWGTGVAQRRFCKTCGILPWYVPRSNPDGIGVSLNCVDWGTGERPGITVKKYDGKDWERSHKKTNIASESEFDEDDADDVLI